jgi:transcriptional regulator with XRE-family HTH domain
MEKLGGKVGLTRKGVWRIEQGGTTSLERLEKIALALGVPLSALLPESGDGAGEGV